MGLKCKLQKSVPTSTTLRAEKAVIGVVNGVSLFSSSQIFFLLSFVGFIGVLIWISQSNDDSSSSSSSSKDQSKERSETEEEDDQSSQERVVVVKQQQLQQQFQQPVENKQQQQQQQPLKSRTISPSTSRYAYGIDTIYESANEDLAGLVDQRSQSLSQQQQQQQHHFEIPQQQAIQNELQRIIESAQNIVASSFHNEYTQFVNEHTTTATTRNSSRQIDQPDLAMVDDVVNSLLAVAEPRAEETKRTVSPSRRPNLTDKQVLEMEIKKLLTSSISSNSSSDQQVESSSSSSPSLPQPSAFTHPTTTTNTSSYQSRESNLTEKQILESEIKKLMASVSFDHHHHQQQQQQQHHQAATNNSASLATTSKLRSLDEPDQQMLHVISSIRDDSDKKSIMSDNVSSSSSLSSVYLNVIEPLRRANSQKQDNSDDGSCNSLLELYNVKHVNAIEDRFRNLDEVSKAIRDAGLEKSQLIFGIDFTISNLENGTKTFNGRSLHYSEESIKNPYQKVIEILGKTLECFDVDGRIPAFGFGDATTKDRKVFSFSAIGYCNGFKDVLHKYNNILRSIKLSGPTNFAPLIKQAIQIVKETKQYHILVIVADGQVTNERQTRHAIVEASHYPLSIIMVGVGDGPWDRMNEFDDSLPKRQFDNFQFVNYHEVTEGTENPDEAFALHALMEIPDQYKAIKELKLLP